MRTMFLSDLATVRPAVKQTLVTFFIVFLILLVCMAPEGAIAAVVVMIPYLFFYTLAVGDESSGWEKLICGAPLLGAIALCAVSMWASIRLYETREL